MAKGYGKNGKLFIKEGNIVGEILEDGKVNILNIICGRPISMSISDFITFAHEIDRW